MAESGFSVTVCILGLRFSILLGASGTSSLQYFVGQPSGASQRATLQLEHSSASRVLGKFHGVDLFFADGCTGNFSRIILACYIGSVYLPIFYSYYSYRKIGLVGKCVRHTIPASGASRQQLTLSRQEFWVLPGYLGSAIRQLSAGTPPRPSILWSNPRNNPTLLSWISELFPLLFLFSAGIQATQSNRNS